MPLKPGAEPFSHDGGSTGVLLCHGFTGSPASMRPWADHLVERGCSVRLPRLPGHGTTWQEMQRTTWEDWYAEDERALLELRRPVRPRLRHGSVHGWHAHAAPRRAAPRQGPRHRPGQPSVQSENKALVALPLLKHVVPSLAGVSNDIAKPDQDEVAYDRVPLKALASLTQLWALTKADLGKVTCPILLFRSPQDHVVEPSNAAYVLAHVGSTETEERLLHNSFHVATLDNDAPAIFDGAWDFVERHSAAATA